MNAVIYAAIVSGALDARDYYAPRSPFRSRPDCIYQFHRELGEIHHRGHSPLHADERYRDRDLGRYPFYPNGRTLLSQDFRYFGPGARPIPARFPQLLKTADALAQGHRVFTPADPESTELDALFKQLWKLQTHFTPTAVTSEAAGHTPRPRRC